LLCKGYETRGAAWQTQPQADKTMQLLFTLLTKEEHTKLSIARNHYLIGEGAAEFYDVCIQLIEKYTKTYTELKKCS
jgi:hypothetical protein